MFLLYTVHLFYRQIKDIDEIQPYWLVRIPFYYNVSRVKNQLLIVFLKQAHLFKMLLVDTASEERKFWRSNKKPLKKEINV